MLSDWRENREKWNRIKKFPQRPRIKGETAITYVCIPPPAELQGRGAP